MEKNIEEFDEEIEGTGFHILDYFIILAKHKKLILLITVSVAIISTIVSLRSSSSFYIAETTILPPQSSQTSLSSEFMSQLGLLRNAGGERRQQQLMVELIRSKAVTDRLIERFRLKGSDNGEDKDAPTTILLKKITVEPSFDPTKRFIPSKYTNSPFIRISVTDINAKRAADIANAVVEELIVIVNEMSISEASQRRMFFEEQLKQISEVLIKSEEDMKAFQEKTGTLTIEGQINIVVDKFAPALTLEYKRLYRQLRYNEALFDIIVKQYESAKIDESKNITFIHIIDKAVPPERPLTMRTWGGKKAVGLIIFAFLLSCFLAFLIEFLGKLSRDSKHSEKLDTLKGHLSFKKVK